MTETEYNVKLNRLLSILASTNPLSVYFNKTAKEIAELYQKYGNTF